MSGVKMLHFSKDLMKIHSNLTFMALKNTLIAWYDDFFQKLIMLVLLTFTF